MATNYSPRIVTDGLILCLDAGDRKSYPGTGTTWTDRSGSEFNAESQVSAATTESRFDSDGFFNLNEASDLYFLISGLNNYNFGTSLTIDFWVKNTGGDYRAIVQNSDDTIHTSDSIDVRFGREDYYGGANNGTKCSFLLNSDDDARVDFFVPLNVWTNVHCSYDGSTMRVYTNGAEFDTTTISLTIAQKSNDMKLFRHYNTGEDLVNPFSNLKLYNRVLTASEVLQNFNALKGRFGLT
jgi:hypothetical protein